MDYQKSNGNPRKSLKDLFDLFDEYSLAPPHEKIKILEKIKSEVDNLHRKKKIRFLDNAAIKNKFGVNLRGADSSSSSTTTTTADAYHHSQKKRIIEEYDFFDQERKGPIRKHMINTSPLKEIIFPQIIMPQLQERKTRSKAEYDDDSFDCCIVEEETRASFLDDRLKRSTTAAAGIHHQKKTKKVDHDDDDSVPTRRNRNRIDGKKVIRLFGVDICVEEDGQKKMFRRIN